jgi:hypothetical protein
MMVNKRNKRSLVIATIFVFVFVISSISTFQVRAISAVLPGLPTVAGGTKPTISATPSSTMNALGVRPSSNEKGYWAGWGARPKSGGVSFVVASELVPSATCDPSNANAQYSLFGVMYDGEELASGEYNPAGLVIYCAQGSSTPVYYFFDPVAGFSSATVSVGDKLFIYAGYSGGYLYYLTEDETNGQYLLNAVVPSSTPAMTDGEVLVDTFTGCSTTNGICPQVNYGDLDTGYDYTGIKYSINGGSTGYTNGLQFSSGATVNMGDVMGTKTHYQMNTGDLGPLSRGFYSKSSGFSDPEKTSWTVTYKKA